MQITKEKFEEALGFVRDFEEKAKEHNQLTVTLYDPPVHVLKNESESGDNHEDGTEGALIADISTIVDDKEIVFSFAMYETDINEEQVLLSVTMAYKLFKTGLYVDVV